MLFATIYVIIISITSCDKYVTINNVADNLLAAKIFENEEVANTAINGIYRTAKDRLFYTIPYHAYLALYADDLTNFSTNASSTDYGENQLQPTDNTLPWATFYNLVYQSNASIEGLVHSSAISNPAKKQLIAEAKFLRAFSYFNLVNLFGDVPLILSTDVTVSSNAERVPLAQVYSQIRADLMDAQADLREDYSISGGDRTRANKWVAKAFLARVLLYLRDWENAERQATDVINAGVYALLDGPQSIYAANNKEALLQFPNNATESNYEASFYITGSSPVLVCSEFLLNVFHSNDLRRSRWLGSKTANNRLYYLPFKYTTSGATTNEWITLFRLGEQYLIRSEARIMQNNFTGAIADVNVVRQKHGGFSTPLPPPSSQEEGLNIILAERQADLFTEGGHRFFDLKRTGRMDDLMKIEKPATWRTTALLFPIPLGDLQKNPRLTQNPGYE